MLEAEVAEHVERAKLTPDAVRAADEVRLAARRKQYLAEADLTEETLSAAAEEVRAKFASKLAYEVFRSPEGQLYHEFMKAAIAREKRLRVEAQVEARAKEIRQSYAEMPSQRVPRKLSRDVRERSIRLYCEELNRGVPEVSSSPIFEQEPRRHSMSLLREAAHTLTNERVHPDAVNQVLAEIAWQTAAKKKERIERLRRFIRELPENIWVAVPFASVLFAAGMIEGFPSLKSFVLAGIAVAAGALAYASAESMTGVRGYLGAIKILFGWLVMLLVLSALLGRSM